MSDSAGRKYRVVVVDVSDTIAGPRAEWLARLEASFALAEDARLALAAGRSAVVELAPTEEAARRTATLLTQLGAEVHIEREGGGLGGLSPRADSGPQGFVPERTEPMGLKELPDGDLLRPSSDTMIAAVAPPPALGPSAPKQPEPFPGALVADEDEAHRPTLVRCPKHGLLYDQTKGAGCKRCLEGDEADGEGWRERLHSNQRVWVSVGLAAALLLGAVPAAIYTQLQKKGELLDRRAEAVAVAGARLGTEGRESKYAEAQRRVMTLRRRGILVSGGIWILFSSLGFLLYRRFV